MDFVTPIATEQKKPRKTQKLFLQNGAENCFRFRFSLHIRVLRFNLVKNGINLQKYSLTLFEILGEHA